VLHFADFISQFSLESIGIACGSVSKLLGAAMTRNQTVLDRWEKLAGVRSGGGGEMRFLARLSAGLRVRWLRRSIDQALALNRAEVRPDGLCAEGITLRLAISWRARNLHPWDRDLGGERKALRVVEQTFADTQAALERLFILLPEVDVIDLKVLETDAGKRGTLLSGSVSRSDFETWRPSSIAMRLRLLGVNYNLVNSRLEPIDPSCAEHEITSSGINEGSPRESARRSNGLGQASPHPWHYDKARPH
jgi:hypothetical protein